MFQFVNSIRSLAFVNSFAGFLLCTQQVVLFFPVSENEFHRKLRYLIEVWFIGSSSNAVFSGGELVGEVLYLSEVLNFVFFFVCVCVFFYILCQPSVFRVLVIVPFF